MPHWLPVSPQLLGLYSSLSVYFPELDKTMDGAFFVGLPFAMGLTSAVTYGHHEKRNAKTCIGIALLTLAFSFLLLLALAIEGILCLFHGCSYRLTSSRLGWMGWFPDPKPPSSPQPFSRSLCRHFSPHGLRGKTLPEALSSLSIQK